jgi:hypothetical protein
MNLIITFVMGCVIPEKVTSYCEDKNKTYNGIIPTKE